MIGNLIEVSLLIISGMILALGVRHSIRDQTLGLPLKKFLLSLLAGVVYGVVIFVVTIIHPPFLGGVNDYNRALNAAVAFSGFLASFYLLLSLWHMPVPKNIR